jgi:hypothetical protein
MDGCVQCSCGVLLRKGREPQVLAYGLPPDAVIAGKDRFGNGPGRFSLCFPWQPGRWTPPTSVRTCGGGRGEGSLFSLSVLGSEKGERRAVSQGVHIFLYQSANERNQGMQALLGLGEIMSTKSGFAAIVAVFSVITAICALVYLLTIS